MAKRSKKSPKRAAGKPKSTAKRAQSSSRRKLAAQPKKARASKPARSASSKAGKTRKRTAPAKRASAASRTPAPKAAAVAKQPAARRPRPIRAKTARIDRVRRTLEETVPTPPSSLNMDRRGSAARTGRAELAESERTHRGMSPDITAGDVDVDLEDAYFTGEEAPGGDNPTPDQDIVDDIGRALGVEYQDNEELKGSEKVTERDKHRWEWDPASSEDYKDRK